MNNTTEITVPLSCLTVSDLNVRRTPADSASDAELKASLAAHGLLQNLVVHRSESIEGHYDVDAGRRRVTQLKELASEGVIGEDFPVPCILIEDASMAVEVSLVENTMRAEMHPADQVEAFARLVSEGSTVPEIAVRFGMSERTVEQRLRLGNVSPMLIEAYRNGETSLETLTAFALTTDQKLQEEVWNNLCETRGFVGNYHVREILLEDRVRGDSRVAQFVGMDDYEQAGGGVTRDLFAAEDESGIWLEDPHILHDLADRKLAAIAEELKQSWKWAEFALEFGWEEECKFSKVHPTKGELTPDEEAETDGLMERLREIREVGVSDETREEYDKVNRRLQDLRVLKASRDTFSEEQRAMAGCVVTLDYYGKAKVIEGLVRPGDIPKGEGGRDSGGYKDAQTVAREKAGYSKKHMDAMRDERTRIVRSHLSDAFPEAFDLLLFQMAREVFALERYFDHALDVELFRYGSRHEATGSIDVEALPTGWAKESDDGAAFEQMRSLSEQEKQALFAACVATTLRGQLTVDATVSPEVEMVVDDLGIDFEADFRPTVDNFWGRLTKPRILAIAEDTLGAEWADAHSGDKKAALAQAMEDAFAEGDDLPEGVTPEGREAALAWTPAGFVAD